MDRFFRIHGDNIVECERTLNIIKKALDASITVNTKSTLYKPIYDMMVTGNNTYCFELLSGHNRWGVDIATEILKGGGVLREGADSYITEVKDGYESLMVAIEYCSALPAGNNAWQRSGRAYSCVKAGIPYLYFSEIGGVELDENRNIKASRFPNPLVPFSYLMATKRFESICLPVYTAHPSITDDLHRKFQNVFGFNESLAIIKGILTGSDYSPNVKTLIQKDVEMVRILSDDRRTVDTLRRDEWSHFLESIDSASWLIDNSNLKWSKKIAEKVAVTQSFANLLRKVVELNCCSIGAKDIPICLISKEKKNNFISTLKEIYPNISFSFSDKPLAVVWITGFKPRGDDSRPDRGLTPLSKMVLGNSAEILVVVYGPAKKSTWNTYIKSPESLAKDNGLWQSILNIANYVLVDSATCQEPLFYSTKIRFASPNVNIQYSEHDTDTAIHQILANKPQIGMYECLCNPPGGDWSGINFYSSDKIFRWTSLPRVSHNDGKRPDHVFQYISKKEQVLIIIESKKLGRDLEERIGPRLISYIQDLFETPPTAVRSTASEWRRFSLNNWIFPNCTYLSVGAFEYSTLNELSYCLSQGKLDAIFAFEFGQTTTLHVKCKNKSNFLVSILKKVKNNVLGLKIQIH